MKKCVNPECGREIEDLGRFCPFCGFKQPILCPSCHAPALEGARFCAQCGSRLDDVPSAAESSAPGVVGATVGGHAVVAGDVTSTTYVSQVNESDHECAERLYKLGLDKLGSAGVGSAVEAAFRNVKDAANLGLVLAQHELGILYLSGTGCVRSEESAVKSFETAAKDGSRAAQLACEVRKHVREAVGDGVTSGVLIADYVYRHVLSVVSKGEDLVAVRCGIEKGMTAALDRVTSLGRRLESVEDIKALVESVSGGNRLFAVMISEALDKVGRMGSVVVECSSGVDSCLDVVEGMEFDKGYISPHFITSLDTKECVLEDPFILFYERRISNLQDMLPLLQSVAKSGRPLLIIAEDVDGEALKMLVSNKQRGVIQVCAVKVPSLGDSRKEIMEDMAILTGGSVVADQDEMASTDIDKLGRAGKVLVGKERCMIVYAQGRHKDIEARVQEIKDHLKQAEGVAAREKLQERLAKLAGGVAVLSVGGDTPDAAETNARALNGVFRVVRSGVIGDVVPGGGVSYLRGGRAIEALNLQGGAKVGADILARALELPLRMSIRHLGSSGNAVLEKVKVTEPSVGYNLRTGSYDDFFESGIIVPAKVVCEVLRISVTTACRMLTA